MSSRNFSFLEDHTPELYRLAGFAESYAHSDPDSAVVKLRTFGEQLTKSVFLKHRLPRTGGVSFAEMLTASEFKAAVPDVIQTKLHAIRMEGNKAAHGQSLDTKTVVWLLQEAQVLGAWYTIRFHGLKKEDLPAFQAPQSGELPAGDQKAEAEDVAKVVAERDAIKIKYEEMVSKLEDLEAEKQIGEEAADTLNISEAETRRRLIDVGLASVGWNISADGSSNDEVGQEIQIQHTVESLGKGFVDYVLWDDNGLPLAVIEAKKTSVSADRGKKQASLYASALEAQFGQRPVIFYTNGYDIFIWDDVQGYPPRQLFGFYSKDSLQYLVNFQRKEKVPLNSLLPNPEIAGRTYQIEAIRRVTEKFEQKHRKALIVQATGTGKTRVAVALTDLMMRANWAKRILFLCDRKELRKQAKNAYTDHMDVSISIGGGKRSSDEATRITVATYPGMMTKFQQYDPGYFDLIIADESHRSIYNMYRDLFRYFDCFQIGLTATPIGFINKSTFQMFECEPENPTVFYSLERAIKETWLVPFEVFTHTTKFMRDGIKYSQLTDGQKDELEEDGKLAEDFDIDSGAINREVLNKDTNRHILRNLMDEGLMDATGQTLGKTILFARGHNHAVLLAKLFDEMYPQYGGKFCQVIDSHDPRAEQLIDDFKGDGDNDELTIAVSVDMLDTGIDVPEVLNLVFAKPVKSKVKFWQMIGRGTRLCEDLFGPGEDKTKFRIFDHWSNFEFFEEDRREAQPAQVKGIRQKLFEIRMALANLSLEQNRKGQFKTFIKLVDGDVRSLPQDSISVREKWKSVQSVLIEGAVEEFAPITMVTLSQDIAPLMKWIDIRGHSMAYSFDLLVSHAEFALFRDAGDLDDFKNRIINLVANLQMTLPQVREQAEMIVKAKSAEFWEEVTVDDLEALRKALRGVIKYQHQRGGSGVEVKIIDLTEDKDAVQKGWRSSNLRSIDMKVYRLLVEEALERLFDEDKTLQKIRRGEAVNETELQQLSSLVLTRNPGVRLELLEEFYPDLAGHLDLLIRSIVGFEKQVVRDKFTGFVQAHPAMTAQQIRFLDMLQAHIATNGEIRLNQLMTEAPFTSLHPEGIEGVFEEAEADAIIDIARQFEISGIGEPPE